MGHRVTTLNVNTIEPAGNTLTIGASGDTVVLADDVKANTYKDAGGNTLFVSNGSGVLSSVNSGFGDSLTHLSTQTISNGASITFSSIFSTTYKEYRIAFIGCHAESNEAELQFQVNASGESGFNETITSSAFWCYGSESGASANLVYATSHDAAQQTGFITIGWDQPTTSHNDGAYFGNMTIYNPGGTAHVTNWSARILTSAQPRDEFTAGYINTAAAITDFKVAMNVGNFSGTIKIWGVS
jgi:hypothetical protein